MELKKVDLIPFEMPFHIPLISGNICLPQRRGYWIYLEDELKNSGWGEWSPFPDSLESRSRQLSQTQENFFLPSQEEIDCFLHLWRPILLSQKISLAHWEWTRPFFGLIHSSSSWPSSPSSLTFALEQALILLALKRSGKGGCFKSTPLKALSVLVRKKQDPILVNALVFPHLVSPDQLASIGQKLLRKKYRCVKVKVGRQKWEEDLYFLNQLHQCTQGRISFRLDGNGLSEFNDWEKATWQLKNLPIEYMEEPWKWPLPPSLKHQASLPPLPIALDESLRSFLFDQDPWWSINWSTGILDKKLDCFFSHFPTPINTLILKPSPLGGLHQTYLLMDYARRREKKVVLSSVFHTSPSLLLLAAFSQILGRNETSHGLGTFEYTIEESCRNFWERQGGELRISETKAIMGSAWFDLHPQNGKDNVWP